MMCYNKDKEEVESRVVSMKYIQFFQYNSVVILTYFFLSLLVLILNSLSHNQLNKALFSCYRSSPFNPLTYLRMFTYILGHQNWNHFIGNFLYILLIGPMIEEKYGSLSLLIMILICAFVSSAMNLIFCKKQRILGASGIVFMLIVLSSFVNFEAGKIPITFILICLLYVVNEIRNGFFKKDDVSHFGHLMGALCGTVFGFYLM